MAGERLAGDPQFRKKIEDYSAYLSAKGWFHSIELADGTAIPGLISIEELRERMAAFPIPAELRGKRVLDVGAWTGGSAFEMERRGADVTAMDCVELEEFHEAHRLTGSKVKLLILDVEELSPETAGVFDYVLFFGVFYHLRNPLLGLEKICSVTREAAFVESYVTDSWAKEEERNAAPCLLEFYEGAELGGQLDNWCGPNTNCLLAMCRSAGFARVRLENTVAGRARVSCFRHWEPPDENRSQAAPVMKGALNNRTNDIRFHPGKDEYVCVYFESAERDLRLDQIQVEVDGMGAPPLVLAERGQGSWQANFRMPPWLEPGMHEVHLRTVNSAFSDCCRIEKTAVSG
jgi:tRNA (mo5U34)-methyltransferase